MNRQIINSHEAKKAIKIKLSKKNINGLANIKENEVKINYYINIKKLYNPNYTSKTNYLKTRFSTNRPELKSIERKFDTYLKVQNNKISSQHVQDVSNLLSNSKFRSQDNKLNLKPLEANNISKSKTDKYSDGTNKVKRKKTIDERIDIYAESDSEDLDKETLTEYIQKINSKYGFLNHSDVYKTKGKIKDQKNYILSRNYIDHYINTYIPRNNLPYLRNYDKSCSNNNIIKEGQALSVKRIKKFVYERLPLDTK